MKNRTILLALITVVMFSGCKKKHEGFFGSFNFGGSTTVEPIMQTTIDELSEKYVDVDMSYDSVGSSTGVKGVLNGTYSMGAASRELKQNEIDAGLIATPIALDGVAVIINTNLTKIIDLEKDDVAKIFSGEITNWKSVGGNDENIAIFNRDEASGTRDCFYSTVLKGAKLNFSKDCAIVTSNGDMVSKVASTPNSIGYCGFGYIGKNLKTKAIKVNQISPREENVLNGSYLISRKLNIVTKKNLKADSFEKAFIDYLLSSEGQLIVKEEKFIELH